MKPLLFDFIRRWWWMLLTCLVVSAFSVSGVPLIIAPVTAVLLVIDANQGWTRSVRCLPIRRQDLAWFYWVTGVLLIPVSSALVLALSGIVRAILFPDAPSIFFAIAVQSWVGLGYAAMCLVLVPHLSSLPPTSGREHMKASVFGAMWGLSLGGAAVLLLHLPSQPEEIAPWHWVMMALSPIAVLAALPAASQIVRNRATQLRPSTEPNAQYRASSWGAGLQGIPLFLATVPGRVVALTATIYLIQTVFMISIDGSGKRSMPLFAAAQSAAIGLAFASLSPGWSGIRALRVLPIETRQLGLLLLAPTLSLAALAFVIAEFSRGIGLLHLQPLDPLIGAIGIFGTGAIGVATILRFGKYGLFVPITIAAALPAGVWIVAGTKLPIREVVTCGGVLLAVIGYLAVVRALRNRSDSYQEIRYRGTSWQPQNS